MDLHSEPALDGPLTFRHLPTELKLEVIELLYDSQDATVTRIMAKDAAWVNPYPPLEEEEGWVEEPSDSGFSPRQGGKFGPGCNLKPSEQEGLPPLKALRLVSKEYSELCTPLLYRQLDLGTLHRKTNANLKHIFNLVIKPFGKHVRYIRISLGRDVNILWWNKVMHSMARAVAGCQFATAIAIYYFDAFGQPFGPLKDEIVRIVESGQVTQIGIYSTTILRAKRGSTAWELRDSSAPTWMLRSLLSSPQACHALQRLDLVLEELSVDCFELLRRHASSLRSLVVRRAIRLDRFSNIWNLDETYWWCLCPNLTRLVLIGCQRPGAKHMVGLVTRFPALRELVWASCGTSREPTPPLPESGWSRDITARSSRPILEILHIEHAREWELCWMGLISAKSVAVAHFNENRLVKALNMGIEMFLGMEKLRVPPLWDSELGHKAFPPPVDSRALGAICEERSVSLSRDAVLLDVYRKGHLCCNKCAKDLMIIS